MSYIESIGTAPHPYLEAITAPVDAGVDRVTLPVSAPSETVALTHDPRIDDMGLMEALTTQAFYIGAMGSARSSASRRKRLLALDLSPTDIDKLHAPIGLPIGSKTPPEIAIAILAEITAVQKNRQNQALAAVDLLSAAGS